MPSVLLWNISLLSQTAGKHVLSYLNVQTDYKKVMYYMKNTQTKMYSFLSEKGENAVHCCFFHALLVLIAAFFGQHFCMI